MTRRVPGLLSLTLGLALLLAQSLVGPLSASHPAASQSSTAAPAAQRAAIASRFGQLPLAFELNQGQAAGPARFVAHGGGYTLALTPSEALLALTNGSATTPRSHVALPGQPAMQATAAATLVGMRWLGANPAPIITGEQPLPGTVNYFLGHDPAQWHTNVPTYQQVRLHAVYPGVDLVYYGTNGQLEYDFVVAPGANPSTIQLGFTGASELGVDLQGNLSLKLPGGALQQQKPLVYQTVNGARQAVAGGYVLASGGRVGFALGAYNPHLPLVIDPAYKFSTYLGGSGADGATAIAIDAAGNAYVTGSATSTNFPTHNPLQATNHSSSGSNAFVTKFNAAGTALVYSTYLGGTASDIANAITLDASGDVYIAGNATSTDFPTTAGAFQTTNHNSTFGNGFVSKLNAAGSALVYSTCLGGSTGSGDFANGIAVDSGGSAYVIGTANSTDFPTHSPFQATNHSASYSNAFVTKFNAAGTALVYSSYLGGTNFDTGSAVAVDGSGNAYLTGTADSSDFPTTVGAFQTTSGGSAAFVSKVNASGSALTYSTFLGGVVGPYTHGNGIAVDSSGDAFVTGTTTTTDFPTTPGAFQSTNLDNYRGNAFVTKFNAAGTALVYSTYLGGSTGYQGFGDVGYAIALDASGDAYVTGGTAATDFPLVNALQTTNKNTPGNGGDAFVSKFNATGTALLYSSYLGGTESALGGDPGLGIAVGTDATVYVTGSTCGSNFPTVNAFQSSLGSMFGCNAWVTKFTTRPSVDTTTGVFRPSNGVLYLKNANTTGPADISLNYGQPGDQPITGDWTGKGYKSIGIYRNGTFYLRNSNTTGYADITAAFGASGDIPVAGDWTGKGYDSIGYYQPSNSTFYLRDSNTSGAPDHVVTLGISGDVPIVGDWTGKGWDSVGVFRPSNGITYLRNSNTTGYANIAFTYGIAGDKPVVGDWTAQGKDTIGVDRGGNFLLRNSNSTGPANLSFYLGVSGDDPIAGPWLAPVGGLPPVHRRPSTPSTHAATLPSQRTATRR